MNYTFFVSLAMLLIAFMCGALGFRSANKIHKVPHTRYQINDVTTLAVEAIVYTIIWGVGILLAFVIGCYA